MTSTRRVLLAGVLSVALLAGGGAAYAFNRTSGPATHPGAATVTGSANTLPVMTTAITPRGLVRWDVPLTVVFAYGTPRAVSVVDVAGRDVPGRLKNGEWTSNDTLFPSASYHVTGAVADLAGVVHELTLAVRTTAAGKILHAIHTPGADVEFGVGIPAIITLTRPVTDSSDRAALVARLTVTTVPAVDGAWRWMNSTELHYRGPTYWAKGTTIHVHSDLNGLRLTHGVWGQGVVDTRFHVGRAVIATVDVDKKVMTVSVNGKLVRTVKVSTGRDKYPTKGGVHLVLEKVKAEVMDSASVGIPRNSPDGYYETVPNSIRISYGGAFVHSASWSVRDQGVRNVSHGCVNISPADADWFFHLVRRGDIVDVINAKAPPLRSDPGMSDWNIPFSAWANS